MSTFGREQEPAPGAPGDEDEVDQGAQPTGDGVALLPQAPGLDVTAGVACESGGDEEGGHERQEHGRGADPQHAGHGGDVVDGEG